MNPDDRYGRLIFIRKADNATRNAKGVFKCECGNEHVARVSHVKAGAIISCGCLYKERAAQMGKSNKRHGMRHTPEWNTWSGIKSRCYNPNTSQFKNYGARGITVCQEWLDSFDQFLDDMGKRPGSSYSLERVDNNGPYNKDNCEWATKQKQSRNTRSNHILTHNGKTKPLIEWAEEYGLKHSCLSERIRTGMPVEEALTRPKRKYASRA